MATITSVNRPGTSGTIISSVGNPIESQNNLKNINRSLAKLDELNDMSKYWSMRDMNYQRVQTSSS